MYRTDRIHTYVRIWYEKAMDPPANICRKLNKKEFPRGPLNILNRLNNRSLPSSSPPPYVYIRGVSNMLDDRFLSYNCDLIMVFEEIETFSYVKQFFTFLHEDIIKKKSLKTNDKKCLDCRRNIDTNYFAFIRDHLLFFEKVYHLRKLFASPAMKYQRDNQADMFLRDTPYRYLYSYRVTRLGGTIH